METIIEGGENVSAAENVNETVVKHVREIRINYRGPKTVSKAILMADDAARVYPENLAG